jgi:iron complex outermembrane receptor protein
MVDRIWFSRQALLSSGVAIVALASSHAVQAQTTPTQVAEVVVTANKRSENIQIVPQAVTAVSSKLLADLHVTSLTDIGAYVPGLQVDTAGTPGQTMISIRGIAPVGPGATVATYIDDTPVGSSSAYGGGVAFMLDLLPYDVDRIEVLRGPQGTLYGASSMGGLVKYVISEPSLTTYKAQAGVDTFGMSDSSGLGGGARALVSGPIINGQLAGTASFAIEHTPGYIDNPTLGTKDQNAYDQESGRLGLLWAPTDHLKVKLNALYNSIDANGDGNVALNPANLQPLSGEREDNNLTSQPFKSQIAYFAGTIDYKFAGAELISATSYADTKTHQTVDESYIYGVAFPDFGFPLGTSQSQYKLHLTKFTQELRLQSLPGTKLEWLIGGFFDDEKSTNAQEPNALSFSGAPLPISPIFNAQLPSTYKEYAVFGDLTYHVTSKLDVLGGVRYSENNQTFSEIATSALIGNESLLDQKSSEGVTTYSVGAKYRFTDSVMAYARIASGYQPGGPNIGVPGVPPTFASDTLTNYELGLKTQFFDDRLLLDVAGFYIDWNDIQLYSESGGINHVANGGTAKSEGVEGNVTLRPAEGLQFDGTVAYVDAVLTQDAPPISGLSGDRLPYIPAWSGSLRGSYTHAVSAEWGANFGAGVRFVGQRLSQVNSSPESYPLGAYAAMDLNASLSNDRYTIRLFVKNLTDTHAFLTYNVLQNGATNAVSEIEASTLQPRVFGIAIDGKF